MFCIEFREQSQNDLLKILRNIQGNKYLIVDEKLSGSLSLIIQTSILQEHGVELRHLLSKPVQTECTKVVYLIRSQLNLVKLVSAHIQNDLSKGIQREYSVYFVPGRTVACEKIFEEEKVHHLLTIGEYPLYMIPLDEDVLSFELDLAYRDYLVDGDTSALWHIAKSIHKLEYSFGVIPNVRAKGKASARISEILTRMQVEEPVSTSDVGIPEINTLILLDREVDMVTPMCVQLTYEGLMDEILRVSNGSVELDASIMGNQMQEGKKTKVPLNSSDKLFKETRDLNFGVPCRLRSRCFAVIGRLVGLPHSLSSRSAL
ncbi:vacuolar protein-sorting-associated protein 33 homolog [Papaver somniferum]|uniref:vacuolar protein-sorting-associated protein 33 homolog n=1 Tax=Papaver somniferum TaxID=3469 RepID=UPI000E6FA7AF|nr:vacuolar protein-sorting-associated protein 33 homolog [Papaver somniferum]